jgi:hypothetical protein
MLLLKQVVEVVGVSGTPEIIIEAEQAVQE